MFWVSIGLKSAKILGYCDSFLLVYKSSLSSVSLLNTTFLGQRNIIENGRGKENIEKDRWWA